MKRNRIEIAVIAVIVALFIAMSGLSFVALNQMQGNARVVNYVGIVRGATQKLVKKELMEVPDNTLIERLDSIVNELITGQGPNELIVLQDETYLDNMNEVQESWVGIKEHIMDVREGGDRDALFDASEAYFTLVDRTVSSAEDFSERQVKQSTYMLLGVNAVFVVILIVGVGYYIRSISLRKRADALGRIAYIDPLTQMSNRACCEKELNDLAGSNEKNDVAILMLDMNNLKQANDALGHQGGDRIIADFARILKTEGEKYGFIGRYGGDEFIGIFKNGSEEKVHKFLDAVDERIGEYNDLHDSKVERISYSVGHAVGNLKDTGASDLINEADKRMYCRKREMKLGRDFV